MAKCSSDVLAGSVFVAAALPFIYDQQKGTVQASEQSFELLALSEGVPALLKAFEIPTEEEMDSTVRYLGVELEDALAIAKAIEI